jgi:YidC/Oxa1 family membrane protein insertase
MAVNFPLAVIIYWVTTNLWTMGQQFLLTRASGLSANEVAAVLALADPPADPGGKPKPRPGSAGTPGNGKAKGAAKPGPSAAKPGPSAAKPGPSAAKPAANGTRPAAQAAKAGANPKPNGKGKGKKGAGARVPARAGTAKARRRR